MFFNLKNLFGGQKPLKEQWNEFWDMLDMCFDLYKTTISALRGEVKVESLVEKVYGGDVAINKKERQIRKDLVTHLAVAPEDDAISCLVLMSLVKDAERIGDHCKNLFEATQRLSIPGPHMQFWKQISEFLDYVSETFEKTGKAVASEDDDLAKEIVREEVKANQHFKRFLDTIAESELQTREAICTALVTRDLKRIQAHLSNVASSVFQPVHRLDHRPKTLRPGRAKK